MPRDNSPHPMPTAARLFGYAGVLPFAALAINSFTGGPLAADAALRVFLVYAAVILSFLGGIRWGGAAHVQQRDEAALVRELAIAVTPSLWAFAGLLLDNPNQTLWWLLSGFVGMGLVDVLRPAPGQMGWMRHLRLQLTLAVVICHIAVIASL